MVEGKESHTEMPHVVAAQVKKEQTAVPFFASSFAIYVLFVLLLMFTLNSLSRYLLAVVTVSMQQDLDFGDGEGGGVDYAILSGPAYTFPYCFGLMIVGYFGDRYNKVYLICFSMVCWSILCGSMAFVTEYWEILLLRIAKSFFLAGCTSLGTGIISEYFALSARGTAISIFNFGLSIGITVAFGPGNIISGLVGWKEALWILSIPGIALAFIILFTVPDKRIADLKASEKQSLLKKTPEQLQKPLWNKSSRSRKSGAALHESPSMFVAVLYYWSHPVLILNTLGMVFRLSSSLVWTYYTNVFFENYRNQTPEQIGVYLSWIPAVSGIIGGLLGGYFGDRLSMIHGVSGRIIVNSLTLLAAVPFTFGALYLPVPWAYLSLLPEGILMGANFPGAVAVTVHVVPAKIRVTSVSLLLMSCYVIGGNAPFLEPYVENLFTGDDSILYTLTILYPCLSLVAGFFLVAAYFVARNMHRAEIKTMQFYE